MKIAICFIGTGKHLNFLPNYYDTINQYFIPECKKQFFIFTDGNLNNLPKNVTVFNVDYINSPYDNKDKMFKSIGGLYRFHTIYDKVEYFKDYDWLVYIDADYYCCPQNISYSEFFDDKKKFFGVQHPTFSSEWSRFTGSIPYETNSQSWAYIKPEEYDKIYLQGCLWGGKIPYIFNLIEELKNVTTNDLDNGVIPRAHDESYLNRYRINMIDDFNVLHPCFAKPGLLPNDEFKFIPKMVHSPEYRYSILEVGE